MNEELRKLVANILAMDSSRISAETGPDSVDTWDSLMHLSLITAVEEKYSVKFSMAEIRSIDNFGALEKALAIRLVR
jgi:acyl carrier protein